MVFSLDVWMLIGLILAAEFLAAVWISILPLRLFLAFCVARDILLLLVHGSKLWYWNTYWISEEIELVALALLAGYACTLSEPGKRFSRLLRVPARLAPTGAFAYLLVPFVLARDADRWSGLLGRVGWRVSAEPRTILLGAAALRYLLAQIGDGAANVEMVDRNSQTEQGYEGFEGQFLP